MERLSFFVSDLLIIEAFIYFSKMAHYFIKKYTLMEITDKIRLEIANDSDYYLKTILFYTIVFKLIILVAPVKWW